MSCSNFNDTFTKLKDQNTTQSELVQCDGVHTALQQYITSMTGDRQRKFKTPQSGLAQCDGGVHIA